MVLISIYGFLSTKSSISFKGRKARFFIRFRNELLILVFDCVLIVYIDECVELEWFVYILVWIFGVAC